MIQFIFPAKQHPMSEQLVLETEQQGSQVDQEPFYINTDIGKVLERYWTIVRPSFISAKGLSKRTIFINQTGEKSFVT